MNTKDMTRPEIVFALAAHACPVHYHSLLKWKTEHLRALLEWYTRPELPESGVVFERIGHPARRSYAEGDTMVILLDTGLFF